MLLALLLGSCAGAALAQAQESSDPYLPFVPEAAPPKLGVPQTSLPILLSFPQRLMPSLLPRQEAWRPALLRGTPFREVRAGVLSPSRPLRPAPSLDANAAVHAVGLSTQWQGFELSSTFRLMPGKPEKPVGPASMEFGFRLQAGW